MNGAGTLNMTNENDALADDIDLSDIPPQAPERDDAAPKRRGRPPGSRNTNPLGAVAGAVRRGRGATVAKVKAQIAMLVGGANILLVSFPQTRDDALNEQEMTLLTDALTAEAMSSQRVMRWLTVMAGVSPHILLVQACVTIAVPRMQRRGMLPSLRQPEGAPDARPDESAFQPSENGAGSEHQTYAPLPMGARGARFPFGGHR